MTYNHLPHTSQEPTSSEEQLDDLRRLMYTERLRALLFSAWARMDRARNILTNSKPQLQNNWAMLATSEDRATLTSDEQGYADLALSTQMLDWVLEHRAQIIHVYDDLQMYAHYWTRTGEQYGPNAATPREAVLLAMKKEQSK